MDKQVSFGKFSVQVPRNKCYRNFLAMEKALAESNRKVQIKHLPVNNIDFYGFELSHKNPKYEKKLQKAAEILIGQGSNSSIALYKIAKIIGIPKKQLARIAENMDMIVYHKFPVNFFV